MVRSIPFRSLFVAIVPLVVVVAQAGCIPNGELGGACYGNGTCNAGFQCNLEDICEAAEEGTENGPCYGNNTCNAGLDCRAGVCLDPNALEPDSEPGAPEPDGTPEPGGSPEPGANPEPGVSPEPVPDVEPDVNVGPPLDIPGAEDAVVSDSPTNPPGSAGEDLGFATAPLMDGVQVASNLSSAKILVPVVEGAQDYRVFKIEPGMSLDTTDGRERVEGGTLYCAGYRQRNNAWTGQRELLTVIEVHDVTAPGRYVVEAVDRGCPFPGIRGPSHVEIQPINDEIGFNERHAFSIYTDEEIANIYGSVIINGHRPLQAQGQNDIGFNNGLGLPAPPDPPVVLARTTIDLAPPSDLEPPVSTFFDDFEGDDPMVFLREIPQGQIESRTFHGQVHGNNNWIVHNFGYDVAQVFIDRGQLHTTIADWAQDIFSTTVAYPRRPAQLSATDYLHITYEVPSSSTNRRYWWLFVCGDETPGQTFDANNEPNELVIQTSFFYQADGINPSMAGWNCFQLFPRDGSPFELAGGRTESDVRVMVNVANSAPRESVRNVSPDQYGHSGIPAGWFRQIDSSLNPIADPMLDDQMLISPRTRYDVYLRRNRAVMYVNGEQRLCNDFAGVPLTMAEGAVGFGQVLYHSAAERLELPQSFNDRTGQRYYMENAAFIDHRNWDNLGYDEGVAVPSDFDATRCYPHQ